MKVVILAGGLGTRLAEQTEIRPKPMVEIGGKPILWHIMKHYHAYGFKEFVIALGYKGEIVKQYFLDYYRLSRNLTVDLGTGNIEVDHRATEDWVVHLVDTGLETNTGGRLKRLEALLAGDTFMLTYGDGVSSVNLSDLVAFHRQKGCLGTITAVRPPARFGGLDLQGDYVSEFIEKPQIGEGWINGGYMVLEPDILNLISGDNTSLEKDVLEKVAAEGKLAAYRHEQFWQCMDTLRDLRLLEDHWKSGAAPWKVW
jgi:glucose-1-phosphate cytidylyltransferase